MNVFKEIRKNILFWALFCLSLPIFITLMVSHMVFIIAGAIECIIFRNHNNYLFDSMANYMEKIGAVIIDFLDYFVNVRTGE